MDDPQNEPLDLPWVDWDLYQVVCGLLAHDEFISEQRLLI